MKLSDKFRNWLLASILNKENQIMSALDDLTTQVAQNTSVEESAVTLINGLAAELQAAGTDPTKLAALQTSLAASAKDLAAAVAANTPAAPPTP
jgi:uncharacterized alpha-E superfamily protein